MVTATVKVFYIKVADGDFSVHIEEKDKILPVVNGGGN